MADGTFHHSAVPADTGFDQVIDELPRGTETPGKNKGKRRGPLRGTVAAPCHRQGFFRIHSLIILDGSTAVIGTCEKTMIYNRFTKNTRDKSAVIVTRRLGSVKLAARILVMKDGEAVQTGTHEELIARDGEYKRLYEAQGQTR